MSDTLLHTRPDVRPVDLTRDADAVIALLDHYARDPMGGGSGLSSAARERLIPALRVRPDYLGFIAREADEAVGLINCFEGFSTFAARPLLNVHDIVVRNDHRRRGIAAALLAAAEQAACKRGCCKLTLEVLSNNAGAMACYRQYGFRAYELDPAAGQALFLEKKLPVA